MEGMFSGTASAPSSSAFDSGLASPFLILSISEAAIPLPPFEALPLLDLLPATAVLGRLRVVAAGGGSSPSVCEASPSVSAASALRRWVEEGIFLCRICKICLFLLLFLLLLSLLLSIARQLGKIRRFYFTGTTQEKETWLED